MFYRPFLRGVCAVVFASFIASPLSADELGRGTSVDDWKGFGVLKSGKGYVQAPLGQLHYRDIGPRDDKLPVLLLHQSPMSMIQWAGVQNALAEMGYRAIAADTPGNGLSDPPPRQPHIKDFADNLIALLDHLQVSKVIVVGHHTGAQIAASLAVNHPDRVAALVMHGAPMFSKEDIDVRMARRTTAVPRTPKPDGSHLSRTFNPKNQDRQEILDAKTWMALSNYVTGPDIGHLAAYTYDMETDLKKVKVPTLMLTDTKDPVNVMVQRVRELRPDYKYVEFSQGDLFEFMAEPKRWAQIFIDWKKQNVK